MSIVSDSPFFSSSSNDPNTKTINSQLETEGILNSTNDDALLLNIEQDEEGNNKLLKSSIFQYILDATKFTSEFTKIKTQHCDYTVKISTNWIDTIESVYNSLPGTSRTRDTSPQPFDINTCTTEEEIEIQKYAYALGSTTKFWINTDEEFGKYQFTPTSIMSVTEQLSSSLNTYILHTFLFHLQYKVNQDIIESKLTNAIDDFSLVKTFIENEKITEINNLINTNNVSHILNSLINLGVFDNNIFHREILFEQDILKFNYKLALPSSQNHWIHQHVEQEHQIEHILHIELIQSFENDNDKGRDFHSFIQMIWNNAYSLNINIVSLKDDLKDKAAICAIDIHRLDQKMMNMQAVLDHQNQKYEYMKKKLMDNINRLQLQLENLQNTSNNLSYQLNISNDELKELKDIQKNIELMNIEKKKTEI